MSGEQLVVDLIAEIRRCLEALGRGSVGIGEVLDVLGGLMVRPGNINLPRPGRQPVCNKIDDVLRLASWQGMRSLADATAAADPYLRWITYDAYPKDEIGQPMLHNHAFAELIGSEEAPLQADDFAMGVFLIGPNILYRDHCHPAPELYLPYNGPSSWRFDRGQWAQRRAGQPVWNEANAVHATLVGADPLLMVYAWTQDVALPAVVVPASDWAEIEGSRGHNGAPSPAP
jgi:Dimethlysulfonioproprionate lyase